MSTDDEVNPYELLGLEQEATEAEIRKAYRTRSLKVHPDRNRNDPLAPQKFHALNQGYELLLDPLKRFALDARLRIKNARKARYSTYDAKRKAMVEELEEKERVMKKAKVERDNEQRGRWQEVERVKEEGKRMMEEREKEIRLREEERERAAAAPEEEEDMPPPIGPLDTTVRLKYTIAEHPKLTTPAALSLLMAQFGQTDEALTFLSIKPPKSKLMKGKNKDRATAVLQFHKLGSAFAAVCASGRSALGLEGIEIKWAGEGANEPEVVGWLRGRGMLGSEGTGAAAKPTVNGEDGRGAEEGETPQSKTRTSDTSGYSTFPSSFPNIPSPAPTPSKPLLGSAQSVLDYESLTLMRLRQAERERLEREILEAEAA